MSINIYGPGGVGGGDGVLSFGPGPGGSDEDGGGQHRCHLPGVGHTLTRPPATLTPPCCRFFLGLTWTVCVNLVIKTLTAVPRPHFIATCRPDWEAVDCARYKGGAAAGG